MRAVLSIILLLLLAPSAGAAVEVFVSVQPLAYFAERVGGERIRVDALVGPGRSPDSYEPSPQQMARLAEADLFVRVGVPYEAGWMPRILATNPELRVLDARAGLPLLPMPVHDHGEERGHDNDTDPHVWTDPQLAIRIATSLRDALVEIDAEGEAVYQANLESLVDELTRLDDELAAVLIGVAGRTFLVFHPSCGYFAARYGLRQIAIEQLGKEPGPRALARIVDFARSEGIRVILVQPQFSRKLADAVAASIGAKVETVDPLSMDYPSAMRQLAKVLAEDLR